MSTRATVHFQQNGRDEAIVYRHYDGYPGANGLESDLKRFFKDVEAQTSDTRFDDPSYLAAKFVVWQAAQYAKTEKLDFLGVGVVLEDPGDIEYRYILACENDKTPKIKVEAVRG